MVDSVNNFAYIILQSFKGDFSYFMSEERMKLVYLILIFTLGALVGMIVFSKIMGYLLRNFNDLVLASLMGFIIGSLGATWPWKTPEYKSDTLGNLVKDVNGNAIIDTYTRFLPTEFNLQFWLAILMMILGYLLIWVIYYFETKKSTKITTA